MFDKYAVLKFARRFGFDVKRYGEYSDPLGRLRHALDRHKVVQLIDVGGNVGQFGRLIRMAGYPHWITSFEPSSDAHNKLQIAARDDPKWTVAPRCAIGPKADVIDINIAGNSQSTSVLKMTDRHIQGDPQSAYVGTERVNMITLDGYLDSMNGWATLPIGLKIDAQGYEAEVLAGLNKWSKAVRVLYTEMSLTPLYEGGIGFSDLFRQIEQRGYHCTSLEPGFIDRRTCEVLQVDATFERA